MKTYADLYYLTEFFLEWEIFQTKVVEKVKTHILCSIHFSQKCHLWGNVEEYGKARLATDDNIIHICFACWITKVRNTHSECNSCFSTATVIMWTRLNVNIIRTLPVLLFSKTYIVIKLWRAELIEFFCNYMCDTSTNIYKVVQPPVWLATHYAAEKRLALHDRVN
jgi:hypothetical protein